MKKLNEAVDLLIHILDQSPNDWSIEISTKEKLREQKRWHIPGDSPDDAWFVCTRTDGFIIVAYGWWGAHSVQVPELQLLDLSCWQRRRIWKAILELRTIKAIEAIDPYRNKPKKQ
jgi:hypothetical protein